MSYIQSDKFIIATKCSRCGVLNKWAAYSIYGYIIAGIDIKNDTYECNRCGFLTSGCVINYEIEKLLEKQLVSEKC